jgi:PST family polysaccharide transporter
MFFERIKNIWRNPEHRTVITNTFSLSGLQVANTLLPLITIPYVVRVIGPANYGSVAFAQAFVTYFVLLVNYGFDLSASREIARIRDDPDKLSEVFWSVLWTKVGLFLATAIVFGALVCTVPQLRSQWQLMIASYLIVIGYVAFPAWFFQGVEKLGLTAIFNFAIKLLFTAGIFLLLRRREQFVLVPLLGSVAQVVAGILALLFVKRKLIRWFELPRLRDMLDQLKKGWAVFISTVFINFYTASNTVILGFFAARSNVGYFAAGSKIVLVGQAFLLYPLVQASYPHISKLMAEQREKGIAYLKKMSLVMAAITLPASIGLFALAPLVVRIFLGREFLPSIAVLRIMSPFPLLVGLSNVLGIQGLLNLDQDEAFFKVILVGAIINLGLNVALAGVLMEAGTALSWLVTEVYITSAMFFMVQRAGVKLLDTAFYRNWIWETLRRSEA